MILTNLIKKTVPPVADNNVETPTVLDESTLSDLVHVSPKKGETWLMCRYIKCYNVREEAKQGRLLY
jgi:hypothetical protein